MCRKRLLTLVHPDKDPGATEEANRAAQAVIEAFNANSSAAARNIKAFRESHGLYEEEQAFINAKADADGEPRPE